MSKHYSYYNSIESIIDWQLRSIYPKPEQIEDYFDRCDKISRGKVSKSPKNAPHPIVYGMDDRILDMVERQQSNVVRIKHKGFERKAKLTSEELKIWWHIEHGFTYRDIEQILGIPIATINLIVSRIRKKLT